MALTLRNRLCSEIQKSGLFEEQGCRRSVEIGLSGGVDSVVLAWLLAHMKKELGFSVCAVYVHHGLSQNAQLWADFCAEFCRRYSIPFRVAYVCLDSRSNLGIEAEARRKRYQVYQDSEADIIALAHHRDDQVETVLLQLLRGGGVHALSGMSVCRQQQGKVLWRPLLSVPKQTLVEFARMQGIDYITDESNSDERFRRNWVRQTLLPKIIDYMPQAQSHILRTASLMQDSARIVDEVVSDDLNHITLNGYFDLNQWQLLSTPRKKLVLLRYVQKKQLGTPRPESLDDFLSQLNHHAATKELRWSLPEGAVYACRGRLYPSVREYSAFSAVRINDIQTRAFGYGELFWQENPQGIPLHVIQQGLLLQPCANGERISRGKIHKTVRDCLREQEIPPFMRQNWPIMVNPVTKKCIAVLNIEVCFFEQTASARYFPFWRELF